MARRPNPKGINPPRNSERRRDGTKPPVHPINNENNHKALVAHLTDRLTFAKHARQPFIDKIKAVDIEYAGAQQLDADDKKRQRENQQGKGLKAITVNLQLTQMQLDEAVTFLMSVFAPDSGFFKAMSSADKQTLANGLAQLMSMDADTQGYYRHYMIFATDALKYNLSCMYVYWDEQYGNELKADTTGQGVIANKKVVWQGNCIEAMDMYNVLWDPTCRPVDVATKGEFVAFVKRYNKFACKKMEDDEYIYGCSRFLDANALSGREDSYFQTHPVIPRPYGTSQTGQATDWVDVFTSGSKKGIAPETEIVHYIGWIVPSEFGLSPSDKREIWRISLANGKHICGDEKLDYVHNMLPFVFAAPLEDNLRTSDRSYAEILLPLQNFASSLINIHILGARKGLYGLTLYDPHVVPLNDQDPGVAAMIAVRPTGFDKDLRKSIVHLNTGPDTARTMQDVGMVLELMQKILPTDIARMVSDLDRATTYQAAATVQGSNRRNLKIARTLDDQAFKKLRHMLVYNIQQKQKTVDVIGPDGKIQQVNPRETIGMNLQFDISDGLKAIDKLMYVNALKEVLTVLIQTPGAANTMNIVKLVNYWSSLMGDKFDLTQFQKTQEEMLREQAMANPALAEQLAAQGGNNLPAGTQTNGTGAPPPGGY